MPTRVRVAPARLLFSFSWISLQAGLGWEGVLDTHALYISRIRKKPQLKTEKPTTTLFHAYV
jgi:hypothetical protein